MDQAPQPSFRLQPRVSFHTLGCKLNYAETSTISRQFLERGYRIVPFGEQTDVLVVNTCSVTQNAERECRQLIRRALRDSPQTFVAVTGCYAQLRPEEIASVDGVDVVLGAKEKFEIFSHIKDWEKRSSAVIFAGEASDIADFVVASTADRDSRTRAFLKVQDGCDYSCSFCTIPSARGVSRSGDVVSIIAEARRLSRDGFAEIVLTGVNIGDFGRRSGTSFLQLLRAIEAEDEITARIRISSIEPNLLTPEIIDHVAMSGKVCPSFHIPLQSGSAAVLRRMQRRYTLEQYRSRIELIRECMPDAGIGADVIVGFPGETDEEFSETYAFIHALELSYLHVFTYSERPGTRAASMSDRIEGTKRRERNTRLRILSDKKRRAFYQSQLEKEFRVVVEAPEVVCGQVSDSIEGYTENYIRVRLAGSGLAQGDVVRVRTLSIADEAVESRLLEVVKPAGRTPLMPIIA